MNVREVMTSKVVTCNADARLDTVAMMMWDNDCGSIPVIDQSQKPIGIVTDRDIAMGAALQHKALWDIVAQDVTNNRPIHTCIADVDVASALKMMQSQRIRRLPVVNGTGQLVGIVSLDDIVALAQKTGAELSFDDAMTTLKAVCKHH